MEQDMTKGSPFRVLIMFTLPLAIGNIFQQLYNMADTIMGQDGEAILMDGIDSLEWTK